MTPESSMTLAASSPTSPPAPRSTPSPPPGPFGPIPSDITPRRRRQPWPSSPRFESPTSRRYHSAANGKGKNASIPVDACANLCTAESVNDERRQHRSDVFANDKVGNFIEFGRFAIDYRQMGAVSFGQQGESGGRQVHERGADCEKKITVKSQLLGAAHLPLGHRLAERDRRGLDRTAAVGAIRRTLAGLRELLPHPGELVSPAAVEARGIAVVAVQLDHVFH